ncbi:MAG: class I SAM-dependent methyltransferase [Pirellulaceae bacterium]
MNLKRVLEPEVMDTPEEARDYDAMDHSAVNAKFVDDLLAADFDAEQTLDLGAGTAQIPIELCRRHEGCQVLAVDLSPHMLDLARYNVEIASLIHRIHLQQIDAKELPFGDAQFDAVISNSIVHHIPEPLGVLREAVRVCRPQGLLFFRDLMRPVDDDQVAHLVRTYAGDENDHQRQMFDDSLRAALTLDEIRGLVGELGFAADTVSATSDRHWTWVARKALV